MTLIAITAIPQQTLNTLEILQQVIAYIQHLRNALEDDPSSKSVSTTTTAGAHRQLAHMFETKLSVDAKM